MKLKIILLSICFPLFMGSSCEKESNKNINIANSKWILEYIEIGSHEYEPLIDYVLEFSNDSLFFMNLSVNTAGGKYMMNEKNKITIISYSAFTEICCESDFDNKLLNSFMKVQEYNIDGKSLIFSSENLCISFKKK